MKVIWLFLRGICMGIADIIPGISGGTIAFIAGIYDELLDSIKSVNVQNIRLLFKLRFKEASKAIRWRFLLTLGSGIATAFILLSRFFQFLLNHPLYSSYLYAFFLGLVIASIIFCAKAIDKWRFSYFVSLSLGIIMAFMFSSTFSINESEQKYIVPLPPNIAIDANTNFNNYNPEIHALTHVTLETIQAMVAKKVISQKIEILEQNTLLPIAVEHMLEQNPTKEWGINYWQIFCGIVAICAMLLPGISGSYLLTILGMYPIAISAIADFSTALQLGHFDKSSFSILVNLGCGILIGLVLFSRLVSWLLKRYRNGTISLLLGFMIGALRSVWPFWTTCLSINPLRPDQIPILQMMQPVMPSLLDISFWIAIVCTFFGLAIVLYFESLSRKSLTNSSYAEK